MRKPIYSHQARDAMPPTEKPDSLKPARKSTIGYGRQEGARVRPPRWEGVIGPRWREDYSDATRAQRHALASGGLRRPDRCCSWSRRFPLVLAPRCRVSRQGFPIVSLCNQALFLNRAVAIHPRRYQRSSRDLRKVLTPKSKLCRELGGLYPSLTPRSQKPVVEPHS